MARPGLSTPSPHDLRFSESSRKGVLVLEEKFAAPHGSGVRERESDGRERRGEKVGGERGDKNPERPPPLKRVTLPNHQRVPEGPHQPTSLPWAEEEAGSPSVEILHPGHTVLGERRALHPRLNPDLSDFRCAYLSMGLPTSQWFLY